MTTASSMEKKVRIGPIQEMKIVFRSYARELRNLVEASEAPFIAVTNQCITCDEITTHTRIGVTAYKKE